MLQEPDWFIIIIMLAGENQPRYQDFLVFPNSLGFQIGQFLHIQ
jgi:hypothetical protein